MQNCHSQGGLSLLPTWPGYLGWLIHTKPRRLRPTPFPIRLGRPWPTLCLTSVCKSFSLTLMFFSSYLTICGVLAEAALCHSLSGFHSCSTLEVVAKLIIWRRHLKDHKNGATFAILLNPLSQIVQFGQRGL